MAEQSVWEDATCIFSGSKEEIASWMRENVSERDIHIEVEVSSEVRVPAKNYFQGLLMAEKAEIHARNASVLRLVIAAMQKQADATYCGDTDGMDLVAKKTSEEIIKLFEGE